VISLLSFPETSGGSSPSIRKTVQELQQTVSASRLNTFHQCRLKFFFRYVLEIDKAPTAALFVGKAVHAVLQVWNLARWRQESRSPEFYRQVFDKVWESSNTEVKWKEDESAQRDTAWAMLETYFRDTTIPPDEKPQGVEVAVEADLRGLPKLVGIIDLVRPGGKIVDFKTSSTTPQPDRSAHQNELQLACYGLLYREATGVKESGFELHHLVKLKTPKLVVVPVGKVTPSQESRLYRLIESYVEGLERRDFVPSPGLGCLGCEYFRDCRAWSGQKLHERRMAA
jgi:PD-(D/E)XK nuclease superfamily